MPYLSPCGWRGVARMTNAGRSSRARDQHWEMVSSSLEKWEAMDGFKQRATLPPPEVSEPSLQLSDEQRMGQGSLAECWPD